MKQNNLGGFSSIDEFVDHKLSEFRKTDKSFAALYEKMFSERDNIIFEKSAGYRIEKTTYGECCDTLERRAYTLHEMLGDPPFDAVVGLYMDNSRSWIELFWAILLCGCRPLLMNMRMSDAMLEDVLRNTGVIAVISDGKSFSVRTIKADTIIEGERALEPGNMGSELLVMSSGTSLNVKLCGYSAREVCSQINDSVSIIRNCKKCKQHYKGELKLLTFLPFYHIFGLVAVYIWFAFFSRTFVLLNDLSAQTIINTIRRHKVTHIFAVPMLWEKTYLEAMRTIDGRGEKTRAKFEKGMKISRMIGGIPVLGLALCKRMFREIRQNMFGDSVLFTITGGSFIRPEVLEFFNSIGYYLCNGYGMTEIGITSVEMDPRMKVRSSGCIGAPLSSIEYRIADGGILEVRGTSTARSITVNGTTHQRGDEWFSTGDLAEVRDGRYYLCGRSDDLVLGTSGENLNPQILEKELDISSAEAVCLIGDRETGPVLIVQVSPYTTVNTLEKIRSEVSRQLASRKLNSQLSSIVYTADKLIGDDDFKVSRASVRSRYKKGLIRAFEPFSNAQASVRDEVTGKVCELIAFSLRRDTGTVRYTDDYFTDLGGTSLDYYTLTAALEEEFRITMSKDGDAPHTTAEAIADYVKEAINRAH